MICCTGGVRSIWRRSTREAELAQAVVSRSVCDIACCNKSGNARCKANELFHVSFRALIRLPRIVFASFLVKPSSRFRSDLFCCGHDISFLLEGEGLDDRYCDQGLVGGSSGQKRRWLVDQPPPTLKTAL